MLDHELDDFSIKQNKIISISPLDIVGFGSDKIYVI